jgi:hypothetical protein
MENITFLDELKALVANENPLSVSREVNELKTRFEDFIIEDERLKQVAFLEAKEAGETGDFELIPHPIKAEFFAVFNEYRTKKTEAIEVKKALEAENLRKKRNLISKLSSVIETEENIGASFSAYKEIHEEWKGVGDIPREKRDEIQAEYSRLLEHFFYNMKIFRELKEHDMHRNQQLKEELIEKVKQLSQNTSIKEMEGAIKTLQNEWEEVGPVSNENWETIKTAYLTAVRSVYEKINQHYDEKRESQKENIAKKHALIETTKALVSTIESISSAKDWEEKTAEIFKIQEDWKQVGFGPKKENEEVWQSFRVLCDEFFAAKKVFFEGLKSAYDSVANDKQKLIDQVLSIKESTDWKSTSEKIIGLQKKWKSLGNAGQKNEQRLWKEFRGACDSFFNAKQAFYAEQDKNNEVNLVAKQDLISKIEAYTIGEDKQKAIQDLKEFSAAFNAIGHVPMPEKDTVYKAYKTAIDKLYQDLKLEGEEKEKVLFQSKLDTLKASPDANRLIDRERQEIRKNIDLLKQDILQFENNLGFFANSKGADEMKKEVEKKINASKRKIEDYKKKLKMLTAETSQIS